MSGTLAKGGPDLRACALEAFQAALSGVEPAAAVARALSSPALLRELGASPLVLAVGKAADPMLTGLPFTARGFRLAPTFRDRIPGQPSIQILEGGHPVPTLEGITASRKILHAVESLGGGDRLLVLLSGGASALFEVPVPGVPDKDVLATYALLLRSGAPIETVNAIRRELSLVKGGKLASAAGPQRVSTLAISDVPGDDPTVIGSGPTVESEPSPRAALAALRDLNLWERVPESVRAHLEGAAATAADTRQDKTAGCPPNYQIVASNRQAAAAARTHLGQLGFTVEPEGADRLAKDVGPTSREVVERLKQLAGLGGARAFVWGGETTLAVPANAGVGGRNQHLAALVAQEIEAMSGVCCLAAGTDGIDGMSGAAGAVVDGGTAARARRAEVPLDRALAGFDTTRALGAAGASVVIGPTGTNVSDLVIGLSWV